MSTLADWIDQPENRLRRGFTTAQLWEKAIGGEMAKLSRTEQNRIGDCMRKIGYEYGQITVDADLVVYAAEGAKQIKGWRKE
jgi:hypothetical protein